MSDSGSIVACFEKVAAKWAESCALIWKDGSWSYAELNARANQLAHFLIKRGIRAETPVGVFALRSPETLAAILAILKAGGAYVPLELSHPVERNKFCLEDAEIQLVLVDPEEQSSLPATSAETVFLVESLAESEPNTNPPCVSGPSSLANILYTSGSTGHPKGVLIEHRGIVRVTAEVDYAELGPGETLLQYAPLSFDASTFEIWGAWLNGSTLAVPQAGLSSLHDLGFALRAFEVSILWLTASLFNLMVEQELDALAGVRQLLTGGDVVSPAHAQRFLQKYPQARLMNGYGPTENTVFTTCHRIRLENPMPTRISIGKPIRKTGVMIVDKKLRPVAAGKSGEIIVIGDGLARGYLNRPELTARSFIEVTDGEGKKVRAYRSGDLGRYMPDRTLEFQGRLDEQIKINGLRIELGEIQNILQAHPQVSDAEILVVEAMDQKRMEAFVVLRRVSDLNERMLREFLAQKIPVSWLPSRIRIIDRLPLNANGKIDRQALKEKALTSLAMDEMSPGSEPNDFLEKAVLNIWREILPGTTIGLEDNFFDLGGDSLSALNMMAQVEKTTRRNLGLRPLLKGGTILAIVAAAREKGSIMPPPLMTCTQAGTSKPPFFFAHGDYTAGGLFCQKMAEATGAEQPFHALTPPGTYGEDLPSMIEDIAEIYLHLIRSVQPKGPYYLGGFCNGALAMYEVTQRLIHSGENVSVLIMLYPPGLYFPSLSTIIRRVGLAVGLSERKSILIFGRIAEYLNIWKHEGIFHVIAYGWNRLVQPIKRCHAKKIEANTRPALNVNLHYIGVVLGYRPRPLSGNVPALILVEQEKKYSRQQIGYWRRLIPHARFDAIEGTHSNWRNSLNEIGSKIKEALN